MKFDGKSILITGSGSGIGKVTALQMAAEGGKLIISDVNDDAGEAVVAEIREAGGEAVYKKCDVSQYEEVQSLIKFCVETYGRLDIAVNNAGIGGEYRMTGDYSIDDYKRVIAVNQDGVFYCLKEELKVMQAQQSGVIINISSMAGIKGLPGAPAYTASKHAVLGLTKAAAVEYARFNIRVNAVCPIFTHTPMLEHLDKLNPTFSGKMLKTVPMRRFANPEEITNAIVWLADTTSSYSTGLCLSIDGGTFA